MLLTPKYKNNPSSTKVCNVTTHSSRVKKLFSNYSQNAEGKTVLGMKLLQQQLHLPQDSYVMDHPITISTQKKLIVKEFRSTSIPGHVFLAALLIVLRRPPRPAGNH